MLLRALIVAICLLSCIDRSDQINLIPEAIKPKFGDAIEAIFGMGVRLQALVQESNDENFLVSPISAAFLLAQLSLGAEGEFQHQLYDLLKLPREHFDDTFKFKIHREMKALYEELQEKSNNSRYYTVEAANALFIDYKLRLNEQFRYELDYLYNSEIVPVNFQSPVALPTVNKWAIDHTKGLIKQLLPSPPPQTTASIFANAIYFKSEWEQPFSYEVNINASFYMDSRRPIETTFMTALLEQIPYTEYKKLNCRMAVLPYLNREMGFYIILPNSGHENEYNIKNFTQQLKINDYLEMLAQLKNKDIIMKMPKLQLSKTTSFLKPLKKYQAFKKLEKNMPITAARNSDPLPLLQDKIDRFGMFNNYSDEDILLSAATKNGSLTVSDVVQQLTLSVDEKGTEAAAISAGIMYYDGGPKVFAVNKPFLFFIRHEATAATLFWGTISNPRG